MDDDVDVDAYVYFLFLNDIVKSKLMLKTILMLDALIRMKKCMTSLRKMMLNRGA